MPMYHVISIVNNEPTFETPLAEILSKLKPGGAIKILTPAEYITQGQRAWWKGVLLPSLAKDTGDSIAYWETKLKLAVLPDDFVPFYIPFGKQVMPVMPSITILSMRKMNLLIEGSVAQCHEWGFMWVTLPDKDLRK